MGKDSKIDWTRHTFNPWRGCTKVSAGCAHCYAEKQARRNPGVLGVWGDSGTRVIASESYWRQPLAWDRAAVKAGERHRVFCASMADVFEDRPELVVPRSRLWRTIEATPNLDWLLLTKRPQNIRLMLNAGSQKNVWLGTSVENQAAADERIPHLLACRDLAPVLFLSMEPLLGPVDLSKYIGYNPMYENTEPRSRSVRGCSVGPIANQAGRDSVEGVGDAGESVERQAVAESDIATKGRKSDGRVHAGPVDESGPQDTLPGSQAGVAPLQWANTGWDVGESLERGQIGQPAGEYGGSKSEREQEALVSHRNVRRVGAEESSGQVDRCSDCSNPDHVPVGTENTEVHSASVRGVSSGDIQDRSRESASEAERTNGGLYASSGKRRDEQGRCGQIHLVIVGGESGPNARPMHPQWARSIRDQCQAAGVPFFFKQWGEYHTGADGLRTAAWDDVINKGVCPCGSPYDLFTAQAGTHRMRDRCEMDSMSMYRVGKKIAGRLLDGRTWDEFPEGGAK